MRRDQLLRDGCGLYGALALILLFVLSLRCAGAEYWKWTPRADHHAAMGRLSVGDAGGTAVLIDRQYALTAAHVCGRSNRGRIAWLDGSTTTATVARKDERNDLAVLRLNPPVTHVRPIPIATQSPAAGSALEICGYGGPTNKLRHFHSRATRAGETHSAVLNGDSGGAVLYRGELVGIVRGGYHRTAFQTAEDRATWYLVYPCLHSGVAPIRNLLRYSLPHGAIVGLDGVRNERARICGPGGCRPQQQPTVPITPAPDSPSPAPVVPGQPPPEIDYDRLAEAVAGRLKLIPGPPGKQGPTGEPGPRGPQGPAGETAQVDVADIVRRLPKLKVEFLGRNEGGLYVHDVVEVDPANPVLRIPPQGLRIRDGERTYHLSEPLGRYLKIKLEELQAKQ